MESLVVDAPAVVARLEERRVRAAGAGILAFDGDGTLWTGDVGIELFEALLETGDVRDAARDALAVEAKAVGLRGDGDAAALARSLYSRFQEDGWPFERAFAAMAWAFAGWPLDEVGAFARRVAAAGGLAARCRDSLGHVLAWARASGVEVFVVSASPRAIVEHAASLVGVAADHVIAMTPAVDEQGRLLPRLEGHVIYGDGKYHALLDARPDAAILGAFGDSAYDAPMLRASAVPVAVAPSRGLVALLDSIPGVVVLPD